MDMPRVAVLPAARGDTHSPTTSHTRNHAHTLMQALYLDFFPDHAHCEEPHEARGRVVAFHSGGDEGRNLHSDDARSDSEIQEDTNNKSREAQVGRQGFTMAKARTRSKSKMIQHESPDSDYIAILSTQCDDVEMRQKMNGLATKVQAMFRGSCARQAAKRGKWRVEYENGITEYCTYEHILDLLTPSEGDSDLVQDDGSLSGREVKKQFGCRGHAFPHMPKTFLKATKSPEDMSALILEAKQWFSRIDADGSGRMSKEELLSEFLRLDLTVAQAEGVLKFNQAFLNPQQGSIAHLQGAARAIVHKKDAESRSDDNSGDIDANEFVQMIVHVLDNAIPSLSASDVVTLGCLISQHDQDGDGKLDLTEFSNLMTELAKSAFVFSGPGSLDILTILQLDLLRRHTWKRRAMKEPEEGKQQDSHANALEAKKKELEALGTSKGSPAAADAPREQAEQPLYSVTKAQKRQLKDICDFLQDSYHRLFSDSVFDSDSENNDSCKLCGKRVEHHHGASKFCVEEQLQDSDLCTRATQLTAVALDDAVHLMSVLHHRVKKSAKSGSLSKGKVQEQRLVGGVALKRDDAFGLLIQIEKKEAEFRDILLDIVLEIAFKLQKEGVLIAPPLEWDGSLGPEEQKLVERLGFLLNAYTVQAWYVRHARTCSM